MAYDHLADFLTELEEAGELVRVRGAVDPALELAAVADHLSRAPGGGPAVLFEQVRGSNLPVIANLLGSDSRLCRALGVKSLAELSDRVAGLLQPDLPEGVLESLRLIPRIVELSKLPPRVVKAGICQQVVRLGRDVDLRDLPIPRAWPDEAAPTITAGVLASVDQVTGRRTLDLVPLEVRNRQTVAIHWSRADAAWRHFARDRRDGRQMPVAVILGGDPATLVSAAAPLPESTDAFLFSAFLRNRGVDLVKCRTHDIHVPADADLILEGLIDPHVPMETCGPIALPTGHYSIPGERSLMTVTAVTHRTNPVFPALIPGPPPTEHYWLMRAVERLILPVLRLYIPEIVEIHLPACGAGRNLAFVSIEKETPQQARKVMNALWGLGPLATMKMIVVVDADLDPSDEEAVWQTVGANVHPGRDVVWCEGPTHADDHASPLEGVGHKMGLDATRKLATEGHPRPWPDRLQSRPEIDQLLATRWSDYRLPTPYNGAKGHEEV
jgi:4-hydroxy-3-polyprenylbenzoate decarboxylase